MSVSIRLVATGAALILQARLLGPETFARLAFATSLANLASLVIDYGMSLRVLRTLPNAVGRERTLITNDLRLKNPLLLVYLALAMIVTTVLSHGAFLEFACIFAAGAANSYGDYGISVLRGMKRYALEAKLITVAVTLHTAIIAVGIVNFPTLLGAAVSFLASRVVYLVLVAVMVRRILPRGGPPRSRFELGAALRQSLPYAQDVMISNSLSQLDMLIAGITLSPTSLGLYAIANRTFLVVDQGLGALNNVFVPSMSSLERDRRGFSALSGTLTWLIAGAGCVGTLAAILVGPALFTAVLGVAYSGLSEHIPLMTVALIARLSVTASAVPIVALGAQPARVRAQLFGLLIFLGGAWIAASAGGLDGLLLIVAVTYGCIAVLQFTYLERVDIRSPRLAYLAFVVSALSNLVLWI